MLIAAIQCHDIRSSERFIILFADDLIPCGVYSRWWSKSLICDRARRDRTARVLGASYRKRGKKAFIKAFVCELPENRRKEPFA
jgi:hypothetical protein